MRARRDRAADRRAARLLALEESLRSLPALPRLLDRRPDLSRYRLDPAGYAWDVLGIRLWDRVAEALLALTTPPYMVSIDSGHGVGKTHGAAVAVNWWYDTRDPSWTITSAPTHRDVVHLLWTEVRLQRRRARMRLPDDLQPAAPEMRSSEEHAAMGYTARDANSMHGRHRRNMLFVFDEKEGVPAPFWDGIKSMLRPGSGDAALAIGNPLTTNTRAYQEHKASDLRGKPRWHRVRLSCLDHPNIAAGLKGEPLPIPDAVTPEQVDGFFADWCDPVGPGDRRPTDVEWRGNVYRPGPIGEPRIFGLRPSAGTYGVWSEAVFNLTLADPAPEVPPDVLPVIGCDCARYGDDYTAVHTRAGPRSLRHSAGNGWDHLRIAERLRQEAAWAAEWVNLRRPPQAAPVRPQDVPIVLDDDATGEAVETVLTRGDGGQGGGYLVIPVNAGTVPARKDLYPNARSELWFQARNKAAQGLLNLGQIGHAERARIEQQCLAPKWFPDVAGKRRVEDKLVTKAELGRSPDDADAMNLAYYDPPGAAVPHWVDKAAGDGGHRSYRDRHGR